MDVNQLIKQKNLTKYRLAKMCDLPQTTVADICNGKARLEKCSGDTLYKIAKTLDVTMEELLADAMEHDRSDSDRATFDVFRSNVCHAVKDSGDADFVINTLESGEIRRLYNKGWYPEALYLLAMVDYLCRENDVPICADYNDLRTARLQNPIFPESIHTLCFWQKNDKPKEDSIKASIPEFARFNIVESEVRNVY